MADATDRRKFRRIHAPVYCRPAGLKILSKHEETRDVSRGGVRVYSDEKLAVGDRLTMELFLKEVQGEVIFQAQVVWIEALPAGSPARYDVGLKFVSLEPEAEALLARVLGEEASDTT